MSDPELLQWTQAILDATEQDDPDSILHLLMTMPYHATLAQHVTVLHASTMHRPPSLMDIENHIALQEAITLWSPFSPTMQEHSGAPISPEIIRVSLHSVRTRAEPQHNQQQSATSKRRQRLQDHWAAFDVVQQIRKLVAKERIRRYVFSTPRFHVPTRSPVYVYVFSGRRRPLDFQHFIELRSQEQGLQGQVLLIDLAISDKHDACDPRVVRQLLTLLRQGAVPRTVIGAPLRDMVASTLSKNQ